MKIIYLISCFILINKTLSDLVCDSIGKLCLNGGECRKINNKDALCVCPVQYSGKNCEFKISQCREICSNGICIEIDGSFTCKCLDGWTGSNCNQSIIPGCQSVNCGNGLCVPKVIGFTCLCLSGWEGPFCNNRTVSKCSLDCLNGGICIDGICKCLDNFKGPLCADVDFSLIPKCSTNICYNGGTCYRSNNQIFCDCKGGFSGQFCKHIDNTQKLNE